MCVLILVQRLARGVLAVSVTLAGASAYAQDAAIEAAQKEEVRRRAEQQQRLDQEAKDFNERNQRSQEPQVNLSTPTPKPIPLRQGAQESSSPCFDNTQITLTPLPQLDPEAQALGNSLLSQWWLGWRIRRVIARYQGHCVDRERLIQLQQSVQEILLNAGYTTSQIVIPEQDLSQGQVLLHLIPGIIERLEYIGNDPLKGSLNWSMPTKVGRFFNLRDIEQGLEQIKRVPSQEVDMNLVPGEKLGQSQVLLQGKHSQPMRVSWTTDNAGSESTGVYQGGLSYSWDNPLSLNDLLTLSYNRNYDGTDQGTRAWSLTYLVPRGYWNHSINVSGNQYWQQIESLFDRYRSSGEGQSMEWKTSYLFYRDQGTKLSLQGRLNNSTSKTFLRDVHVPVQDKNLTNTQWDLIWKEGMSWGTWDLTYSIKKGLNIWNSNQDDPTLPKEQGSYFYLMHLLDVNLTVPFQGGGKQWEWNIAGRVQQTNDFLYSANQFGIGGRYSVRGFDSRLAAEKGFYVRQHLKWNWRDWLKPYIGLDYGEISGYSTRYALGTRLSGHTIGLEGRVGNFTYDLFWSHYGDKPSLLSAPEQGIYGIQLSYQWMFGE